MKKSQRLKKMKRRRGKRIKRVDLTVEEEPVENELAKINPVISTQRPKLITPSDARLSKEIQEFHNKMLKQIRDGNKGGGKPNGG